MPMTLAFICEVLHENHENPSIFVKVTAKKLMPPFFLDTVYKPMHPLFCQHCDAVTCILLQVVSVFVSLLTSLSMFYLA